MDEVQIIFILVYLLTILLSATKIVPMSVGAMIGALLTAWFGLLYGVFEYNEAMGFIDIRLIFLLLGVMIVVEVAERSGLFRFGALYAVKNFGWKPQNPFCLYLRDICCCFSFSQRPNSNATYRPLLWRP